MSPVEVILGVAVLLSLVLHFLPKQANPLIAKAQTDVDDVWTWIADHLKGHAAPGTATPAALAFTPAAVAAGTNAPLITHPVLTPVTPPEAVAAILKASEGTGGYRNGLSWNQTEYLKALDPKMLAAWCASLAALPECAQTLGAGVVADVTNSATVGWIKGLSQQGQGIVLALAAAGVVIPDVDPRA